jgi:hypothetical protein
MLQGHRFLRTKRTGGHCSVNYAALAYQMSTSDQARQAKEKTCTAVALSPLQAEAAEYC